MNNPTARPRRASATAKNASPPPTSPKQIAALIDPADAEAVLSFGLEAQRDMLAFYDRVLTHVRGKDTSHVRIELERLVTELKRLNVKTLREDGLLTKLPPRLPWFRSRRGTSGLFAEYEEVSVRVTQIAENLEASRKRLLRDVELFDKLYEQNLELLEALDLHIKALEYRLIELHKGPMAKLKKRVEGSGDAMDEHRLRDLQSQFERLERKAREMKLARTTGIQAAGQIRLFQSGIQSLVEGIQGTVLNSVPLWKNHIALAVSRLRQEKTLRLQSEITRATSEMLEHNSGVLRKGAEDLTAETLRTVPGTGRRVLIETEPTGLVDPMEREEVEPAETAAKPKAAEKPAKLRIEAAEAAEVEASEAAAEVTETEDSGSKAASSAGPAKRKAPRRSRRRAPRVAPEALPDSP